jgi:hypothetical protein
MRSVSWSAPVPDRITIAVVGLASVCWAERPTVAVSAGNVAFLRGLAGLRRWGGEAGVPRPKREIKGSGRKNCIDHQSSAFFSKSCDTREGFFGQKGSAAVANSSVQNILEFVQVSI